MKKPQSSKALNYRLGKFILQSTPISNTYNIQNSATQQLWKCKVFDLQKIDQYDMLNVLQYNQEVFTFLKDKYQNSLYIPKAFQKDTKDSVLFQYWNQRLSTYISKHPQGIPNQLQVKNILQDVLMSICDIYAENYMILNLRPQHIVRVQEPSEGTIGWKIQSLVFEYNTYKLSKKCEYQFDYDWASNEQKTFKQKINENMKDEQIVWYMGNLALRLIYGPSFKLKETFQDSDISLNELKKISLPQVFQLIKNAVRANINDRIPLKKFLDLSVFSKFFISNQVKDKFITGNSDRIKKSSLLRSSILQKSIDRKKSGIFKMIASSRMKNPQANLTNGSSQKVFISEVKAQRIFNELRWLLEKCLYLAEIKDYTQTNASLHETSVEDKTLIRYLYFKIAEINLKRLKQVLQKDPNIVAFRESSTSKELYKQLWECIEQNSHSKEMKSIIDEAIEYQRKMKKLDPKQLKLLSQFGYIASNLKKNIENNKINIQEIADYFTIVNGKFFASLKMLIETQTKISNKGIKMRALCYFILSSYVIMVRPFIEDHAEELTWLLQKDFKIYKNKFYDQQRLQGSIHVKFADQVEYVRLCEFTKEADETILIENSRSILEKYFKAGNHDCIKQTLPQKQGEIRAGLKVAGRNNR